jgi:hypothetical protein
MSASQERRSESRITAQLRYRPICGKKRGPLVLSRELRGKGHQQGSQGRQRSRSHREDQASSNFQGGSGQVITSTPTSTMAKISSDAMILNMYDPT